METKCPDSPLKALLNSPTKLAQGATVKQPGCIGAMGPPPTSAVNAPNKAPQTGMTAMPPPVSTGDPHNSIVYQNCIATVNLGCELNLQKINFGTRNSEYNPARFHGLIMRIREPRSTALIFKSGKVVCSGAKNESASLLAAKKFARIIQKVGFNVRFFDFKIQNLVATCDLRFPIRLESLNQMHGQFSSYEPELFSGLFYRMLKPRIVFIIFVNGKLVITGGKTRQDIKEALDNMYPILKSFRKN